jgi:hypothetical protein
LEKINLDLYSSTTPYNGFDGLCQKLGLPARLSEPTSLLSFQVSAELPARVTQVRFAKGTFGVDFNCIGTPDLKVKWWPPQPVVERIPATSWGQVQELSNMACRAPLLIPHGADGAKLILSFGEHIADVASFDLDPKNDLEIVHEVLKDDEDICERRKNQELVKGEAGSASAGAHKHSKTTPAMAAFVAVVKANADLPIKEILEALDENHIELPPAAGYDPFRSHAKPWTDAYRLGGKTLQRRIRVRVTKAKKH